MHPIVLSFVALLPAQTEPLTPGNHTRSVMVDGQKRAYHVHVPPKHDAKKPTPVVLALHGATMNGRLMEWFTGLNKKSDEAGFVVVYPNGTGPSGILLTWNAGGFPGNLSKNKVDDVAYLAKVLDDLPEVMNVDAKRVYATGLSNGAMMCYRLASEMSDRIAAIAPVAGTLALDECKPGRPVPVIHFHGTKDSLVPFEGPSKKMAFVKFKSVEDSISAWVKLNGCKDTPQCEEMPAREDKHKITRKCYGSGKDGAEVVLYVIDGGGHTWPGQPSPNNLLGPSTRNINANDLIWEFFERHPLK